MVFLLIFLNILSFNSIASQGRADPQGEFITVVSTGGHRLSLLQGAPEGYQSFKGQHSRHSSADGKTLVTAAPGKMSKQGQRHKKESCCFLNKGECALASCCGGCVCLVGGLLVWALVA